MRDIGQCLQIINVIEAARIYTAKHKLAQEARDTCRKIVVMAEQRIGQELAAAQQRGELARQGYYDVASGDVTPPTYAEIGFELPAQRWVSERSSVHP